MSITDDCKQIRDRVSALDDIREDAFYAALQLLRALSDEQRAAIISHFCAHCGREDTRCYCQRDE
jgi:hypothetical protein